MTRAAWLLAGLPLAGCASLGFEGGFGDRFVPLPVEPGSPAPFPSPAPGSIRLVQHGAASGSPNVTVALPSAVLPGDLIVVAVGRGGGAPPTTLTDDANDSYFAAGLVLTPVGHFAGLFYSSSAGAARSVSATVSGSNSPTYLEVAEFSAVPFLRLDAQGSGTGTSSAPASSLVSLSTAGELVIGAALADAAPSLTRAGNGFVLLDLVNGEQADEYRVAPAAGAEGASFSYSASESWACLTAAFRN